MTDLCLFLQGTRQEPRAGTENTYSQQMRWVVKAGGSEVCTERWFSVDANFKCDVRKPQHQQLGRMHTHSVTWVQWVYTNNQKGKRGLFRFPWWSWPFLSVMCFSAIWSPGLSTTVFLLLRPGKQAEAHAKVTNGSKEFKFNKSLNSALWRQEQMISVSLWPAQSINPFLGQTGLERTCLKTKRTKAVWWFLSTGCSGSYWVRAGKQLGNRCDGNTTRKGRVRSRTGHSRAHFQKFL